MTSTNKFWPLLLGVVASLLLLCSCRKAEEALAHIKTAKTAPAGEKTCFQCNGTGKMKCPDCQDGLADCPGDCLKLTQGEWVHMTVDGHPPTDLWHKFPVQGGFTAFNQDHVGHIIKSSHGDWIDSGVCPICHGTGKVKCSKCNGSGEVTCNICDGDGVVPDSWTAFDNPKLKNRPDHITLKDGRVILGKAVFVFGSHTTIQTANGNVEVNTSDIVSENKPNGK